MTDDDEDDDDDDNDGLLDELLHSFSGDTITSSVQQTSSCSQLEIFFLIN